MKNLIFVLSCVLITVLNSCSSLLGPTEADISHDPKVQHLIGHNFVLKQDVLLYQYTDNKHYALARPGKFSALPYSIQDYLSDPINWQNTDTNARRQRGRADGYEKFKVIDVIPKGTRFYVYKITEKSTLYDSYPYLFAKLEDPRYAHLKIDSYFLFSKQNGKVTIPYPDESDLSAFGCEIIPYPNPELIDYCDEN